MLLAAKSLVIRKQSWWAFSIKAVLTVTLIVGLGAAFISRYRIGIDPQVVKCIPGKTFYLVDIRDKALQSGHIYAFRSKGVAPIFPDGTNMVKFLRAMPGDVVEIQPDQTILVNGAVQGWGLSLSKNLHQPMEAFMGKKTLQDDEHWFMGLSDISFDSRYWGAVSNEQIIGRAYPLL